MISFFADGPFAAGVETELPEEALAHARARRVTAGEAARLLDGKGRVATGSIASVEKRRVTVVVDDVSLRPRPMALDILVPVADKERMLVAAEKCVELQVTSWRPVRFDRSRSVSPRGEGDRFREKVVARMRSALEQSGGAWLPDVHPEMDLIEGLAAVPREMGRVILDSQGTSLVSHITFGPMALAVGPEGGITAGELDEARQRGWLPCALAESILRFETAAIAAAAVVRAHQLRR